MTPQPVAINVTVVNPILRTTVDESAFVDGGTAVMRQAIMRGSTDIVAAIALGCAEVLNNASLSNDLGDYDPGEAFTRAVQRANLLDVLSDAVAAAAPCEAGYEALAAATEEVCGESTELSAEAQDAAIQTVEVIVAARGLVTRSAAASVMTVLSTIADAAFNTLIPTLARRRSSSRRSRLLLQVPLPPPPPGPPPPSPPPARSPLPPLSLPPPVAPPPPANASTTNSTAPNATVIAASPPPPSPPAPPPPITFRPPLPPPFDPLSNRTDPASIMKRVLRTMDQLLTVQAATMEPGEDPIITNTTLVQARICTLAEYSSF